MPERRKKEKFEDYVSRCVMTRRHEHPEESQKQSLAVCYSMGRTWRKGQKHGSRKAKD